MPSRYAGTFDKGFKCLSCGFLLETHKEDPDFPNTAIYPLCPQGEGLSHPQPPPIANENPAIWDLVIKDMHERDRSGREKYGTPLQPFNGRDALKDAYQEALDLVVYLRQALFERDST